VGPLLLGLIIAIVNWLLPFPYPVDLILWIVAVVLIVYGVYLLVTSGGVGNRRWW
jgi:uncharacterized protein YhhL (DUF1145 family)